MLKIFENTKKKSTIAVVENCEMDAVAKIARQIAASNNIVLNPEKNRRTESIRFAKKCVPHAEKARMPKSIKATVTCDSRDTYNAKVGEAEAVKKAMSNHNKSFKKAIKRWQVAMLKDIIAVSPETFEEALHEVHPCKCEGFKH